MYMSAHQNPLPSGPSLEPKGYWHLCEGIASAESDFSAGAGIKAQVCSLIELLVTTLYQAHALFYTMPEGMPPDPALPCGLLFSTLESTTGQHPAGECPGSLNLQAGGSPCIGFIPCSCASRERWGSGGGGEAEQLVQIPPRVGGAVPASPADPGTPHQPGPPQRHAAEVDCHVSVTASP